MGAIEQAQINDLKNWVTGVDAKIDKITALLYRDGQPAPIDLLTDIDGWVKHDPAAIVQAIPSDIAKAVLDGLSKRLAG